MLPVARAQIRFGSWAPDIEFSSAIDRFDSSGFARSRSAAPACASAIPHSRWLGVGLR